MESELYGTFGHPFPTVHLVNQTVQTQQANLPTSSPHYPFNAERQTKKLRTPTFKVF